MSVPDGVFLSVVVPVYRAERILPALCERLDTSLRALDARFEIILIDDRSPDGSWPVILDLVQRYPNLVAARLSRNFGQHYALTAGLDLARGTWTVVMDCDLQDRPEDIAPLLAKAQEGYDVVMAERTERDDPVRKRFASRVFYRLFSWLSGYRLDGRTGSFRIMHRRVVDAFCQMREAHRLFGGMVEWLGFATASVPTRRAARPEGASSYRWRTLGRVALDGIISFSNRPLYFSAMLGALMAVVAIGYAVAMIVFFAVTGRVGVPGWLSMVALITFVGGLILFNLGVLGIYVGRLYDQAKQRPLYVLDRVVSGRMAAAVGAPGARSEAGPPAYTG